MIEYLSYGDLELAHLTRNCPKMGQLIAGVGPIKRAVTPDPFLGLVGSIIAQQISGKAANTVRQRLLDKAATPQDIARLSLADIQACGMSMRKAAYIHGIAEAALNGELNAARLAELTDQEVIAVLIRFKGVGIWTAQMLMIFSLGRPDILSWLDFGIRKGLRLLYGYPEIRREQFDRHRAQYSPYGSVASLYLWHLAGLTQLDSVVPSAPSPPAAQE